MSLVDAVFAARGLSEPAARKTFLYPDYEATRHDPFLLPDMNLAVDRLVRAKESSEKVVIYGDYDIDGLTASTVLLKSFEAFGITASVFIPNRFIEGYGLSGAAIEKLAEKGAQLIVTVDCGSLSHKEIERANELGVDVIVTDHHSVAETMPPAVAVINPKRPDHDYPFIDLAGVGVAFKLVQALQTKLDGLAPGQEKWLLDLVALGTVCDIVELRDENRTNVYWGLEVMKKTRRPGIKLLMAVSRVEPEKLVARSLGFGLGPRLNASGRLETAQLALDLLVTDDNTLALELAERLDMMNRERRIEQDRIFKAARSLADTMHSDKVLIVSDPTWSHGIIGIVAAKLLETYRKPTFVLQELEDGTAKGSARSYGDFSAVEAIRATETHLIKGGGHKLAAGVTLEIKNITAWRRAMNEFYDSLKLTDQLRHLDVRSDVTLPDFSKCTEGNVSELSLLEPYGNGNPEPVFEFPGLTVTSRRTMGADNQHVKYRFLDQKGQSMEMIAFKKADEFTAEIGAEVTAWGELGINEWNGRRAVEGRLLKLQQA
ncbi:MAG TPA: single-stranded-DNA-specific exonuclease RecJ [Candidatus Saccharibacteria bacterium]|nr:single-stranded-DNA-specific exonuclease RecJ [Candidatus Saccharibacteria bacterium]